MNDLRGVEYLPEPTDRSMLSAVDPTVVDHEGSWRSEVMGWAPQQVRPVARTRRSSVTVGGLALFALLVALGMVAWQNQWYVIELPLPDSEWAYEATTVRDLQAAGLSGQGVRLCMVDTGVDASHEALNQANITFKDLIDGSAEPVDYGSVAHGTLMSGLLLSNTHQQGVSPNVTFAMVAALRAGSDDANSGTDADVAGAIRWCQFEFEADIISLSLGGSTARVDERRGPLLQPHARQRTQVCMSWQQRATMEGPRTTVMWHHPGVLVWPSRLVLLTVQGRCGPIRPSVPHWIPTASFGHPRIRNRKSWHPASTSSARETTTGGIPRVVPQIRPCLSLVPWPCYLKHTRTSSPNPAGRRHALKPSKQR